MFCLINRAPLVETSSAVLFGSGQGRSARAWKAGGPPWRQDALGHGGPCEGALDGDSGSASGLQERGEVSQKPAVVHKLVAQLAADRQVVVDGLADRSHAVTSGQGRASPPNAI